jgi:carboxypeptidase D
MLATRLTLLPEVTSVLWVEHPLGTGFSVGGPDVHNEYEVADAIHGFFEQFLDVFSELKGKRLYL